jgi:IclR family acetate operon transcriptional repressor
MPLLEQLAEETGESVNLVVREADHGLVVLRVESRQPLRYIQAAGASIPLHCTSTARFCSPSAPTEAGSWPISMSSSDSPLTRSPHPTFSSRGVDRPGRAFSVNKGSGFSGSVG